jgi:hypothetical protein
VLTHGDNAELLDGLVHSFSANVSPAPTACVVVQDGPCALPPMASLNWQVTQLDPQGGFCEASEELWSQSIRAADDSGADYVFWLEHDFRFQRTVDLNEMAAVLNSSEHLAQVSLLRQAVNRDESRLGGIIPLARERGQLFTPKQTMGVDWIEHSAYYTTNVNLMTVEFMARNPWTAARDQCEGKFGLDLLARGYNFAILGDGQPWIEHVGVRDGSGKGY